MKKKSNFDILMIMFGFTFFSGSMLIGQTLSNGLNLNRFYFMYIYWWNSIRNFWWNTWFYFF